MYLKRSIDSTILEWMDNSAKKPLVITGTRQCGKTTTIKQLAQQRYKNIYYINLMTELKSSLVSEFKNNPTYENLIILLNKKYPQKDQAPIVLNNDAIIIIDEFQECLEFYTQLKYINEESEFKNIVCLGSYLSVKVFTDKVSYPVGQIETINMFTLSFEEFLINTNQALYEKLLTGYNNKSIDNFSHNLLLEALNEYILVGGFPEAISEYVNHNKDWSKTAKINRGIYESYYSDLSKHLQSADLVKVYEVYNNALTFCSKENNTFTLSTIKTNARYRDYEFIIMLLVSSKVCYKVDNCKNLIPPLIKRDSSSKFKIYFADISLLSTHFELTPLNINSTDYQLVKGNIIENLICMELIRKNINVFYHTFLKGTNQYELDFVYQQELKTHVVEVKSGKNKKSTSLNQIKTNDNIQYITTSINNEISETHVPLYMFFLTLRKKEN